MYRGKPCERMSRGAKGWHGFISCTKGWGRRGCGTFAPKVTVPAETERQEHAATAACRCRAARRATECYGGRGEIHDGKMGVVVVCLAAALRALAAWRGRGWSPGSEPACAQLRS